MTVEGYIELTIDDVKEALCKYAESKGYEAVDVFFPEIINSNSVISIKIEVRPKLNIE